VERLLPRLGNPLSPPGIPAPGEVELWYLTSEHIDAATLAILRETLAPEESARADRFRREPDRTIYIAAHALLRVMLSNRVAHPVRFWTNEWGRPEIDAIGPRPSFNLTHTNGMAACATTDSGAVGVDAEAHDGTLNVMSLAESYFAPSEVAYLRAVSEPLRGDQFLRIWTLKEAFIKAVGKGLSMPLDQFAFTLDPLTFSCAPEFGFAAEEWSFQSQLLSSPHYLAVALHQRYGRGMTLLPRRVTAEELVPLARCYFEGTIASTFE
jgi:4'-phosphopantetheinyl transferase